jgi:hypothetical protein
MRNQADIEMKAQVDRCRIARESGNPNAITNLVCPNGEFIAENKQAINNQVLAYLVGVQVSINKVDIDVLKYMKKLQANRDPDQVKWIQTIRQCTEKVQELYSNICQFGFIEGKLNEDKNNLYITTTMAYPQELCSIMVNKKVE